MSSYKLCEVLEAFLGRYSNPKTRKAYKRDLVRAVEWLGPQKYAGDLSRMDVLRYVGTVTAPDANAGKPYKPRTQRGKLKTLITFLKWCEANGFIEDNLAGVVTLPREPESDARLKIYEQSDFDMLIDYAEGRTALAGRRIRDLALFLLAHDTGARAATLARVTRGDVDPVKRSVRLYNKKRERWYMAVFGDYTAGVLHELFDELPGYAGAYLFNARQPGNAMTPESITQVLSRACDAVGIPRRGIHGLRHGLAVRMIDSGHSTEFVADILNDSVEVVNRHYSPRSIPAAKEAAREVAYQPPQRRKIRRFRSG